LLSEVVSRSGDVAVRMWDGSQAGPEDAPATIVVRSTAALAWLFRAPGQLGFGRAYVSGDLDVQGDIFPVLELPRHLSHLKLGPRHWLAAFRLARPALLRPLPVPAEEARLHGPRHSRERDRAAISHHYDISNRFYELVLGPAMTYSCGYWKPGVSTLEEAQAAKHDLIATKLRLEAGMRLLDVGCGWGALVRHMAARYGVRAVGVTLSARQVEWASQVQAGMSASGARAGMGGAGMGGAGTTGTGAGVAHGTAGVTIRLQDYRDVDDGPFDAISSVGMFEHVGRAQLQTYFTHLYSLLVPGGRLLNHAISALPKTADRRRTEPNYPSLVPRWLLRRRSGFDRGSFIDRYVFPDGELIEVGEVVSAMQQAGFEVCHVESLREHYGPTLRAWVANLERNWDQAAAAVGERRARIWRLYMAASARTFETGRTSVHQVLGIKPAAQS
jgi:cyclopropane-fatty-acyl-phospholipid synthase